MVSSATKPSARERLLAAADDLFYTEGVRTVGIDRIIEHAGVAKASLYNTFGSKDELILAYLTARHIRHTGRITEFVARQTDPRERVLAVFDALAAWSAESGYRGCAFARASAESQPGDTVDRAVVAYRTWVRDKLTELVERAGAADPPLLARQLLQLHDGATQSTRMDQVADAVTVARAAAEVLLDTACTQGGSTHAG